MNKLIDSNEVTETYETAMGIVTIWKKDGNDWILRSQVE